MGKQRDRGSKKHRRELRREVKRIPEGTVKGLCHRPGDQIQRPAEARRPQEGDLQEEKTSELLILQMYSGEISGPIRKLWNELVIGT